MSVNYKLAIVSWSVGHALTRTLNNSTIVKLSKALTPGGGSIKGFTCVAEAIAK
jgi:hypothetical protein